MGLQWAILNATVLYLSGYKGGPCVYNAQQVEIRDFGLIGMGEISEDGFWQMVEGEWIPTEKQLEAIQNGAIRHDQETVQQITGQTESHLPTHQLVTLTSEHQYSGTKDFVSFVGCILIVFGILDFLISFLGTNITFFLGFLSYITPILFISAGGALLNQAMTNEIKWFEMKKFSESNTAKGIYAASALFALFVLILLVGIANVGNSDLDPDLVGTWTNPVDELILESDGDITESTSTLISWETNDGELLLYDEEDYYYTFEYEVVDDILFLAPYGDDDVLLEESCIAYLSGESGKNDSTYSDRIESAESNGAFPTWCRPS